MYMWIHVVVSHFVMSHCIAEAARMWNLMVVTHSVMSYPYVAHMWSHERVVSSHSVCLNLVTGQAGMLGLIAIRGVVERE